MSDKNSRLHRVRYAVSLVQRMLCLVSFFVISACWGGERKPEEAAKLALTQALSSLHQGDVERYLDCVDFDGEPDSMQRVVLCRLFMQHIDRQIARKGELLSCDAVDAQMQGDSICQVYYQLTFADSTVEVMSQKMIRVGESWKLRLRN